MRRAGSAADGKAIEFAPLRVASIDVGTNAIRFLAVEFQDEERYRVIAETRLPIRFGHGVFTDGRIDPTGAAAKDREVRISAAGVEAASVQQRALKKRDEVFRDAFGMTVTLTTGRDAHDG